jgi:hypothetical protein
MSASPNADLGSIDEMRGELDELTQKLGFVKVCCAIDLHTTFYDMRWG